MSKTPKTKRTATLDLDRLERERARLAWSIETLAAKSGIHARTIKRLMEGKPAYFSTIRAIAEAMDLAADVLSNELFSSGRKSAFEFRVRTVGLVESPEQLARLMKAANQIVARLRREGITVTSHDTNLSLPKDRQTCERIVLSVEGVMRQEAPGVILGGTIEFPFWRFYAIRPSKLAHVLTTFANSTFPQFCFDPTYGEVLAQGHDAELPEVIVEMGNSLNPFADPR